MVVATKTSGSQAESKKVIQLQETTVRFCGDSGDGMQLAGTQMSNTSAIFGNDISTLPDYPSEIRAPAGSIAGVSGFQVHFGSQKLRTPGDRLNALVCMNPAALKANLADLEPGGILVLNVDAFTKVNLAKADYESNPLEDSSLDGYQVFRIPVDKLNSEACKDTGLTGRAVGRCKNFFALGLVYWLYGRSMDPTLRWIESKFAGKPLVIDANTRALKGGYYFGETTEMFPARYEVAPAKLPPGKYRSISGNVATALGLIAAACRANKPLFYGTYPITPASDILHELARHKALDIRTFQAEDEIAAITASIGAAFTGVLAATGTSGPGLALKGEAIGLAVMLELPLVIVNVQRGGPSTGLPTKTEQADLNQALYGRNSESPVCVLAAASPVDCFNMAVEAFRIAIEFMTPVILLTDGYVANGAEPWRIPDVESLPRFDIKHPKDNGQVFEPYFRDDKLVRPWAIPGTPGLEHRIGGLEKHDITGEVCYDPQNHEDMVKIRRKKIDNIASTIPDLEVSGEQSADLLVLGWGSTYGAIATAVENAQEKGFSVSSAHLRYIDPLPKNAKELIKRFKRVLMPEMNLGQLAQLIRDKCLIDPVVLSKVQGKPFMIHEIEGAIENILSNGKIA